MKDVEGTVQFLALLTAMAARLSDRGRAIFEVHYDGLAFGNWTLTAGTRKRRVRLLWDGKEGLLSVSTAVFADSQSRPRWNALTNLWSALANRPLGDHSLGDLSREELLMVAENLILEHSRAEPTKSPEQPK